MDVSIARQRLSAVVKPDSITAAQGDFLATHVPLGRLRLLHKFEIAPTGGTECGEEAVYEQFVRNPENRHQLIAVYGQSGTGKSHLIRWFEARFRAHLPADEVVLFIRRSDNTLKGTIRQLLDLPEVQEIANKDVYDRLTRAVVYEDEAKLKGRIYHDFINEVEHDDGSREIRFNSFKKNRLTAFLSNEVVRAHLMEESGPIARIYAKIAASSAVDRDTVAEFTAEDFLVTEDLAADIHRAEADPKAERLARELMMDEGGAEAAQGIAVYMNIFVSDVIQRSAGIEAGDFRDVFQDIRRELYRLGKHLTLFIEDVTSFTGVDNALLDALIVEHTGMNAGENLCRVSSIIGTTGNYLQNNFRDNHKDRITQFVYIPSDVFDEAGLFEFVGRYLNTMSLPSSAITAWQETGAQAEDYPVHTVQEGARWEFVPLVSGKELCLYPFTRHSIRYLYQNALAKNQKTPRYIIRDIIEPVVSDLLMNKEGFPSRDYGVLRADRTLSYLVQNQIGDETEANRLLRFLSIWGDGTAEQYTKDGVRYIAGLRRDQLEDFALPVIALSETAAPAPTTAAAPVAESSAGSEQTSAPSAIPSEKVEKVARADEALNRWVREKIITVSSTGGVSGLLRAAQEAMGKYLMSAVNWQAAGISSDNMDKINNSGVRMVTFEHQTKEKMPGLYIMPATQDSALIIGAFVRWNEYGGKSWNYPESDFDAYLVSAWTARIRDTLIASVRESAANDTSYIEAAVAAEIYRMIFYGELREKNLKKLTAQQLLAERRPKPEKSGHTKEWEGLCALLAQKGADAENWKTVRQYFNLPQGTGGSMIVLDAPQLQRVLRKVLSARLELPTDAFTAQDPVKRRRDVFAYLKDIVDRRDRVAETEMAHAKAIVAEIRTLFDADENLIEEEELLELTEQVKMFYNEVNNAQLPISYVSADPVKKNAKQIAKALHTVTQVLDERDPLTVLMAFSGDPMTAIAPLTELLRRLDADLKKAESELQKHGTTLDAVSMTDAGTAQYAAEMQELERCAALFGQEVQA